MTDLLVLYEVDGAVGIITMNRPDKLNAINPDLRIALVETFKRATRTSATVVLLRANGRSFCVGYDIGRKDPARDAGIRPHQVAPILERGEVRAAPWDMRKPVVAQVQGHALGGGCELAMMCDITIAADDALFGEPEIRFSNTGPAIVMPWFIGLKKARELLYLGDMIDAKTAFDLGMVNRVVPKAELGEAGLKFAKRLALIDPDALYVTKLSINRGAEAGGFRNAINVGLDIVAPIYAAKTAVGMRFKEIADKEGLGAALKWRGDQFKE